MCVQDVVVVFCADPGQGHVRARCRGCVRFRRDVYRSGLLSFMAHHV
jgi:hypothetical protein